MSSNKLDLQDDVGYECNPDHMGAYIPNQQVSGERIESTQDTNNLNTKKKKGVSAADTEKRYKDIPGREGLIRILQIVGMVFSAIVVILGAVLKQFIGDTFGIVTICFAVVSFVAFGLGIAFMHLYVKKVKNYLKTPSDVSKAEKIDQSTQRILLNIYFYLIMLCFAFFIIFGIGVLAFRDDIKIYIKGLAFNAVEWKDNFGTDTFDEVMKSMDTAVNCLGALSIIFSVYIVIALIFSLRLFNDYRKWQTVIQFLCILYVQLGFICVYLGVYAFRAKSISQMGSDMPEWVPTGLMAVAIIAVIIGIVGFFASFFENTNFLKIFLIVEVAFAIVMLIVSIYGAMFVSNIENYEGAACNKLFLYLHETYLKEECGCDNKYVNIHSNLTQIEDQCPKDRVIFAWEYEVSETAEEGEETLYGCIDQNCCLNTYSEIRSEFNYLVLIGFGLFATGVLMCCGTLYMICRLKAGKEEGIKDEKTGKIMGIAAVVTIIILIVFIALIPSSSEEAEITKLKIDLAPKENAKVNETFVLPQNKTTIELDSLQQLQSAVKEEPIVLEPEPVPITYVYTITMDSSAPAGEFKVIGDEFEEPTSNTEYEFESEEDYSNTFIDYVYFVPNCPLKPNALATLTIKNKDTSQAITTKDIDFSQVSEEPVTLEFVVIGDSSQTISITQSVFEGCSDIKIDGTIGSVCNEVDGSYKCTKSDLFYALKTGSPVEYTLSIQETAGDTGYEGYETTFLIGGIGSVNKVDLGTIALVKKIPPVYPRKVKGLVINAIDNSLLDGVEITIFHSTFDITSDMLVTDKNIKELLLEKEKIQATTEEITTDGNGIFEIELNPGPYTILYTKGGFYFNLHAFVLDEPVDTTNPENYDLPSIPLTPEVEEGKIRIVLSWPDGPADLDIHSLFKVTKIRKCHVYFGNKDCTGLNLDVDNTKGGKNGVETITINSLGNYIYSFYVHKYVDGSRGNAVGENRIDSVPVGDNYEKPVDNTKTLFNSEAKIIVYGAGYRAPIAKFEVKTLEEKGDEYRYWNVFCLNGSKGVDSLKAVHELAEEAPSYTFCDNFY